MSHTVFQHFEEILLPGFQKLPRWGGRDESLRTAPPAESYRWTPFASAHAFCLCTGAYCIVCPPASFNLQPAFFPLQPTGYKWTTVKSDRSKPVKTGKVPPSPTLQRSTCFNFSPAPFLNNAHLTHAFSNPRIFYKARSLQTTVSLRKFRLKTRLFDFKLV